MNQQEKKNTQSYKNKFLRNVFFLLFLAMHLLSVRQCKIIAADVYFFWYGNVCLYNIYIENSWNLNVAENRWTKTKKTPRKYITCIIQWLINWHHHIMIFIWVFGVGFFFFIFHAQHFSGHLVFYPLNLFWFLLICCWW